MRSTAGSVATTGSTVASVVAFLTSVFFSDTMVLVVFLTSFFSVLEEDEDEDEDEVDQIR